MSFVNLQFWALFLPLCFLAYALMRSAGGQNAVLLLASLVFYASYDIKYLLLLIGCTAVSYLGGLLGKRQRRIYIAAAVLNLMVLLVFKYTDFALGSIRSLTGLNFSLPEILLPVGLSFYVFQSCSYLFDLYNGKLEAEENPINYGLFVCFFPTVVSGPIQKGRELLPQIREKRQLRYEDFSFFMLCFLWGAFLKLVIADRLALMTDRLFQEYYDYTGAVLMVNSLAYTFQIYADFAGYSYMAIAVSRLFGFRLKDNFRQPYLATDIQDFWRRWHISLTSWFTEYLYFPLGGNRRGRTRRYVNIFIVFLVSGLWHGAAWSFVLWGALHGFYQIAGHITRPWRSALYDRLGIDRSRAAFRLGQRFITFSLVSFAWIFFRSENLAKALVYCRNMLRGLAPWALFDGSLTAFGISSLDWAILLFALGLLGLVSVLREKGFDSGCILKQSMAARALLCWAMFIVILVFGAYGGEYSASAFIYAGF